jgi:hypothetical protein
MTDIVIGPSFTAEIEAAGLMGLPFAWSAEGVTYGASLTTQQRAAIEAVVAAHNPTIVGKPALTSYAADKRWQKETGGTVVGGVPISTDDRSKIMIMGARVAAAADAEWTTVWHGSDGQTYPINATQMIAISDAVEAHVNATFATFASVKADIDAGDITTLAEIDAAFA